jgi:sigma-E factor negative regulatory protein RseB
MPEPFQWLKRIVEARRTVNYEGDFVYLHNGQITTMRIVRQSEQDGDRERLAALDGPVREVVRDRDRVTCTLPKDQSVVADTHYLPEGPWPQSLLQHLDQVMAHYDLTLGRPDRVAGRETQSLEARPRDALRYGHRLWVDRATGLLLKSELVGKAGNALEEVVFTQVTVLDTIPAEHLKPSAAGRQTSFQHPVLDPPRGKRWTVERLPPGFQLEGREQHLAEGGMMQQLVYTDGLATVSVFIEHRDHEGLSGLSRLGAISAYGACYGDWQVTVVGDVPEATVEMIGESVHSHD